MKWWQAGLVVLALIVVVGVAVGQAWGNWGLGSLFSSCQSGLSDHEERLRFTVADFRQPCDTFYWLPYTGDEFYNQIQLNRFGMHDDPVTLDKPDDVYRILFIGDGVTQAIQVSLEDSFPDLVEQQLNATSQQTIEVINLSLDDFGTDRELLLYSVLGASFEPDAVVLVVNLADDIMQNSITLEHHRTGSFASRAYFTMWQERLTLHNSPDIDPYGAGTPAYEWLVAMQDRQGDVSAEQLPAYPLILREEPYIVQYPVELGLYLPENVYWTAAWDVTQELIVTFRDLAAQQGAGFGVVVIPDKRQIHADDWRATVNRYPVARDADPLAPSHRIDELLAETDIPVANLTWTMRSPRAGIEAERLYYFWHPYLNEEGHSVVAERVANWLRAENLVP
jgi:hypothetical protein